MKSPTVKMKRVVTTETTCTIELTAENILAMLAACGRQLPADARHTVEFVVPGGGDWSNMAVSIDEENPVRITWKYDTPPEVTNS